MGNCLFLLAQGWGIDRQVRKKLQIPGGVPGGGMVTGRIEPCIIPGMNLELGKSWPLLTSLNQRRRERTLQRPMGLTCRYHSAIKG